MLGWEFMAILLWFNQQVFTKCSDMSNIVLQLIVQPRILGKILQIKLARSRVILMKRQCNYSNKTKKFSEVFGENCRLKKSKE